MQGNLILNDCAWIGSIEVAHKRTGTFDDAVGRCQQSCRHPLAAQCFVKLLVKLQVLAHVALGLDQPVPIAGRLFGGVRSDFQCSVRVDEAGVQGLAMQVPHPSVFWDRYLVTDMSDQSVTDDKSPLLKDPSGLNNNARTGQSMHIRLISTQPFRWNGGGWFSATCRR